MTNLNVTLSSVLKKLGVDTNSAGAKTLLENAALAAIQVPDEITASLDKEFFTLESALQQPDVLFKARAEVMNGLDSHLETIWESKGFDADTITKLKADKKTAAKISKTLELIEEKSKEAFKATGKEKQDLVNEINTLQSKAIEDNKKFQTEIAAKDSQNKLDKMNWQLDGVYNVFDYVSPTDKPTSVHIAKSIVSKIASEKGVVFELGENGLSLKTTSGTDYVQNNKKLTPSDFITQTLMDNKFIKVSDTGKNNQNQQQNNQNQNTHQSQSGNGEKKSNAYLDSIRKDIEKSPLPQT